MILQSIFTVSRISKFVILLLILFSSTFACFSQQIDSVKINGTDFRSIPNINLEDDIIFEINLDSSSTITNENQFNIYSTVMSSMEIYVFNADDILSNATQTEATKLDLTFDNFRRDDQTILLDLSIPFIEMVHGNRKFKDGSIPVQCVISIGGDEKTIQVIDNRVDRLFSDIDNKKFKLDFVRIGNGSFTADIGLNSSRKKIRDFNYVLSLINDSQETNTEVLARIGDLPIPFSTDLNLSTYKSSIELNNNQFAIEINFFVEEYVIWTSTIQVNQEGERPIPHKSEFDFKIDDINRLEPTSIVNTTSILTFELNNANDFNIDQLKLNFYLLEEGTVIETFDQLSELKKVTKRTEIDFIFNSSRNTSTAILDVDVDFINSVINDLSCSSKPVNIIGYLSISGNAIHELFDLSTFTFQVGNQKTISLSETVFNLVELQKNGTTILRRDWGNITYINTDNFTINNTFDNGKSLSQILTDNGLELFCNNQKVTIGSKLKMNGVLNFDIRKNSGCIMKRWTVNTKKVPRINELYVYKENKKKPEKSDTILFVSEEDGFDVNDYRKTLKFDGTIRLLYKGSIVDSKAIIFDSCKLEKEVLSNVWETIVIGSNVAVVNRLNKPEFREPWITYRITISSASNPDDKVVAKLRFTNSWDKKYEWLNGISASYRFIRGDNTGTSFNGSGTTVGLSYRFSPKNKDWRRALDLLFTPGVEFQLPYTVEDESVSPSAIQNQMGIGLRNNFLLGGGFISGGYSFGDKNNFYWSLGIDPIIFFRALRERIIGQEFYKW